MEWWGRLIQPGVGNCCCGLTTVVAAMECSALGGWCWGRAAEAAQSLGTSWEKQQQEDGACV